MVWERMTNSVLSVLRLMRQEEKKENIGDRHSGLLESRNIVDLVFKICDKVLS